MQDARPGFDERRGYEGFGGVVNELASESTPWWPERVRAPRGAPNIVVMLVDDLGFSDLSPFGSEIDTPAMEEIAEAGLTLTNYHSAPVCSPARAALLTGINHHRAGFASVARADAGFPNRTTQIPDDAPTMAESLRAAGYATFMVGKWHLSPEASKHDGADRSTWPLQRGFDRYFGSPDAFTSLYHPHRLVRDNSVVTDEYAADTYLTDVLTDEALAMIKGLRANDSSKPFFLYYAHHAVHGPLQAKPEDIAKYRGCYEAGWDAIRGERFARQRERGLFPTSARLSSSGPEQTDGVLPWDELSDAQRELFARHMEVYAGAVDSVDQSLARIIAHLKAIGEYENTIIVVTSDNGATGEGGVGGTRSYLSQFSRIPGLPADWKRDVERDLDLLGSPRVFSHYPRGWAHVSNTPFRYYKGSCYAGGVHVPLLVSWPAGLQRQPGDVGIRHQYAYVTDLMPTLLELAGVEALAERGGVPAKEIDGVSLRRVLESPDAAATRSAQYLEHAGQRGYYGGRYKIISGRDRSARLTVDDLDNWELYDVESDPAETTNLAGEYPEIVAEMAQRWTRDAWANTVFPLDDDGKLPRTRTSADLRYSEPVTLYPGTPPLERFRSSRLTQFRSFDMEITFEHSAGAAGVLVAHGDQGGGYHVAVVDGALQVNYNAYGEMRRGSVPLEYGHQTVLVSFTALPEMRWRINVTAGGVAHTVIGAVVQLMGGAPFTGISVGRDFGSPVDWELYERFGSFPYSGQLERVRYVPGPLAPYSAEIIVDVERLAHAISD